LLSFQFNRKESQRLVTAANDAHHGSATSHSSYPHVLESA
jgi:hypothetical protein